MHKITIEMAPDALMLLAETMQAVASFNFAACPRDSKTALSILHEVKQKIQTKAVGANSNSLKTKIKLKYHEADVLLTYLNENPMNTKRSAYYQNTFLLITNQIHPHL
jgi:hypothetical protein